MPHTITFDAARKRVAIVVTRPVSEKQALSCFRELRTHPEFRTDYGILINLLAADLPPTNEEAVRLGGVVKAFFPGQRIALVWPNVSTIRSWVIFWVVASPRAHVRLFTTLSDAEAWLGSPSDETSSLTDHGCGT